MKLKNLSKVFEKEKWDEYRKIYDLASELNSLNFLYS